MVVATFFAVFLIFVIVPKNAEATVEFVKTHHVKELLESYMDLDDHELRSILKPGFSLKNFRSAVNELQSSFGALESKISLLRHYQETIFTVTSPIFINYKSPKITYKKRRYCGNG